ncbi:hypothetical protein CYMTET_52177 [Cymbomonas tetramitiformis]|uniref:Secreted protein n=1 Tax=Cymbomonas tetramitiformis TaxID=36881 RepID=A0AAE0BJJ0_9CHLO|nr:hypothetical protein CYMTET_52177 [Cymbomonas tetramitiformis]
MFALTVLIATITARCQAALTGRKLLGLESRERRQRANEISRTLSRLPPSAIYARAPPQASQTSSGNQMMLLEGAGWKVVLQQLAARLQQRRHSLDH